MSQSGKSVCRQIQNKGSLLAAKVACVSSSLTDERPKVRLVSAFLASFRKRARRLKVVIFTCYLSANSSSTEKDLTCNYVLYLGVVWTALAVRFFVLHLLRSDAEDADYEFTTHSPSYYWRWSDLKEDCGHCAITILLLPC